MALFQWQQIDPPESAREAALQEAFASANLDPKGGEVTYRETNPLQSPAGACGWSGIEIEGYPDSRVTCVWWTDAAGRRHWYIEGEQYRRYGETHPFWRCSTGVPEHPLWVIASRRVLRVGELPGTLLVLCDCGEIGTPESLGWMGTCCGPCHDRFEEGDWTPPQPRAWHPHRSAITGLAVLEDGRVASCAYRDTLPCVQDVENGTEVRLALDLEGGSAGLDLLPDDRVVVAFSESVVCWDANTGDVCWQSECPGELMGLAASPLGDLVAVDAVSQTYLLSGDEGTGNALSDDYSHFAFSFDSARLYANDHGSDEIVAIDTVTEEMTSTNLGNDDSVGDAACYALKSSPVARLLAFGGDEGQIRLGDPEAGRWLWTAQVPSSLVTELAFTPDGQILASDHNDRVVFWQVATGNRLGQVRISGYGVCALAFSPDGETLAVGDQQGVIRLFPWRRLLMLVAK